MSKTIILQAVALVVAIFLLGLWLRQRIKGCANGSSSHISWDCVLGRPIEALVTLACIIFIIAMSMILHERFIQRVKLKTVGYLEGIGLHFFSTVGSIIVAFFIFSMTSALGRPFGLHVFCGEGSLAILLLIALMAGWMAIANLVFTLSVLAVRADSEAKLKQEIVVVNPDEVEEYELSIDQAAKAIGVTRGTLRDYIKSGRLRVTSNDSIYTTELLRAGFVIRHLPPR